MSRKAFRRELYIVASTSPGVRTSTEQVVNLIFAFRIDTERIEVEGTTPACRVNESRFTTATMVLVKSSVDLL